MIFDRNNTKHYFGLKTIFEIRCIIQIIWLSINIWATALPFIIYIYIYIYIYTYRESSIYGPSSIVCRGQLKCDGTRTETRFLLSTKRTSPFKSAGAIIFHSVLSLLTFLHPFIPNAWMSSSIFSTNLFLSLPLILQIFYYTLINSGFGWRGQNNRHFTWRDRQTVRVKSLRHELSPAEQTTT